ncbi:MAG: hypothetical protein IKR11_05190, partial [Solobacterium sp.]|nr:hypothetical protein [Solobacterium sp.]
VSGEYVKYAYDEEGTTGTCFRIRLNGEEKKFIGMNTKDKAQEKSESFDLTMEVKAGDELMFLVDPEGNDAWDGGKISATIKDLTSQAETKYSVTYKYDEEYPEAVMNTLPKDEEQYLKGEAVTAKAPTSETVEDTKDGEPGTWKFNGWDAESKKVEEADVEFTGSWTFTADRTNNADLAADFSGPESKNGWQYGMAGWDGNDFTELDYDKDNNRYMIKNGDDFVKPELKADFVEPGNGKNAAYKWVAARDGEITVSGEYVKYAYDEEGTTGTCFRIRLNGEEKKFIGMNTKDKADERAEGFVLTLEVKAGDELMFLVDPEGNDAWDGGKLAVVISDDGTTYSNKASAGKPKTAAKKESKVTEETVSEPKNEVSPKVTEEPEEPKETTEPVKPEETVEPVEEEAEPETTVEEVLEEPEPQEEKEETVEETAEPETTEETNE